MQKKLLLSKKTHLKEAFEKNNIFMSFSIEFQKSSSKDSFEKDIFPKRLYENRLIIKCNN